MQVGGGSWVPIKQVLYAYYGASDTNGSLNDLQSASQQLPDGSGGWNTVAVDYYRYWLSGSATGFAHGLKIHLGPEAYRLVLNAGLNPATASDTILKLYADHYFEYDPSTWVVTKEISAVCSTCTGGGTTSDLYSYTPNPRQPANDFNVWQSKTVQTLPDSSQIVVYSNYAAYPMLMVNIDSTGSNRWATFYRYDSAGQPILTAEPSAVALPPSLFTLEAYDDLLNYNLTTGLYQYLNNTTGLINILTYDSTGNVLSKSVRNGQQTASNPTILLQTFTYSSNTVGENTVTPLATSVSYPVAGSTSPSITTGYTYTYHSGTNQMATRTTMLPVISSDQNGSGTAATIIETFDVSGNLTSRTDERGIVSNYTYDQVTSLLTEQVLNYNTSGSGPGFNVTTDYTYDSQGRLTLTLGPSHTVVLSGTATTVRAATWMVYQQTPQPTSGTWNVDQTWTGTGYATGTGPSYTYALINPVSIVGMDKDGRTTDQISSVRSSGSGALSPTDTFNQTDWQSWSSTQYDNQHRTISSRVYFLIPSSGTGTAGTNYGEMDYGYDALERQNRVVTPTGTITRTVWTCPQWVASTWMGTNDTGATDSNPGGSGSPNNMAIIMLNQYDGGNDGGDGNLTQQTQYVSATSGDTQVTSFGYDFRDRRISTTDAINRYMTYTLDNLDRITETDSYNASGGTLYAKSVTSFDDQSRTYQQITYAVDPSTGTAGNYLISNTWYDPSGNVIQQIQQNDGPTFTKSSYNGVGWVTGTYRGYNTTGTSYNQASGVTTDIIVTQSIPTYDEAGNVIAMTNYDRLNDASTSTPDALTTSLARVSYTASWFDGIDRSIASANYGAPSSAPTIPSTPPSSSSTVLVNLTAYDNAGRVYQTTDPKGIVTQISYDAAGRTTQTIEDYGTGLLNRTTNTAYTVGNQIATLTAVNPATGNQTTTYTYGTNASSSSVVSNDLLASVTYPDSISSSDVVSYTYNRLGQQRTITDQRGTVRTIYYDKLGRQTNDCVTTNGTGTDVTVKQIATAYEVRGMPSLITSYDSAAQNSGTVLNQVQLTYNTFSQLIQEQQEHSTSVSGSTPSVQYGYLPSNYASNHAWPSKLTYPNGRYLTFTRISGAIGAYMSRIDNIYDGPATGTLLANYTYMGSGMVVQMTYSQPSLLLDLWGGTSGTYAGLDQFNRIVDQSWLNTSGGPGYYLHIDQYQYGYDQNSNRTWKQNTVAHVDGVYLDEAYTYDDLNRLTQMQRGNLSSGSITGTPSREMDYTLDPTGNWSAYLTKTSGTTDLNQTRTANKVNEIAAIGGSPAWATPPAYDAAGNMTSFPQPASPASNFTATYDAWNRMTAISSSGSTVATYQYDGGGRRIVKNTAASTETRHFYYTSGWQDIEERVGSSTTMDKQYVWGLRYIDELICRDDATPQRLYALQDANFNLTGITNTSGFVQERYLYDPYGNRTIMNAAWSIITASAYNWSIGHQGLIIDAESALIYNRNRCLNTAMGGWLQRDPIGYVEGLSIYQYVSGGPINQIDPLGLGGQQGPPVRPLTTWIYKPGLGNFTAKLSAPGNNGAASADFNGGWNSSAPWKSFVKNTGCTSVGFIQIYKFVHAGNQGPLNGVFGLVEGVWTIDGDNPPWYGKVKNGINSGQFAGNPASMTDTPGWGAVAPGTVTSSNYDFETCAVCVSGGCGGAANTHYIFGCIKWGVSFLFKSGGPPTARTIYLASGWDGKVTPPALPPQVLYVPPPPNYGGAAPSATMMAILGTYRLSPTSAP
jgi:RHS repeat-associated protein